MLLGPCVVLELSVLVLGFWGLLELSAGVLPEPEVMVVVVASSAMSEGGEASVVTSVVDGCRMILSAHVMMQGPACWQLWDCKSKTGRYVGHLARVSWGCPSTIKHK